VAAPGSTWLQLLQFVFDQFNRLDLATTAPNLTAPVPTDPIWRAAQEAIEYFQPRIFTSNQAFNQWTSTVVTNNPGGVNPFGGWIGNLYSPPTDFEDDVELLINISGQNTPMTKVSIIQMSELDIQGPPTQSPIIGPPIYYCIWGGMIRVFPWPDAIYPMTAVYNSLILVPSGVNALATSNYWTVEAASLIEHQAVGLIKRFYTKAPDWQNDFDGAMLEFNKLAGRVRQVSGTGHARPNYL
jgi:hypothetical protein